MGRVDLIDEMFVVAEPSAVREALCDVTVWRAWFPGLVLAAYDDRGPQGTRWALSGDLVGTAEVWLEAYGDGTIVHTYLRADPVSRRRARARGDRWVRRRYAVPLKARLLAVKDDLEASRGVGEARVEPAERVVSRPIEPDDVRAARDGRPDHLEHRDRR